MQAKDIESQVQSALEEDPRAIAEKVRGLTLAALSGGGVDKAALRAVMAAVVAGARKGVKPSEDGVRALKEAMGGLDAALATAAEATHLALQEAAARGSEFSREALGKTADELATLEALFIETLVDGAKNSAGAAQGAFRDLAAHARASGTAVGGQVRGAWADLSQGLASTVRAQAEIGSQALVKEGALLAGLAAGILKGIADRLQTPRPEGAEPPPPKAP